MYQKSNPVQNLSDMQAAFNAGSTEAKAAFQSSVSGQGLPEGGWPITALAAAVQVSIAKADSAAQYDAAFTEASQDVFGAMVAAAGGSYNDSTGAVTFPGGGGAAATGYTYIDLAAGTFKAYIARAEAPDAWVDYYTFPTVYTGDVFVSIAGVSAGTAPARTHGPVRGINVVEA